MMRKKDVAIVAYLDADIEHRTLVVSDKWDAERLRSSLGAHAHLFKFRHYADADARAVNVVRGHVLEVAVGDEGTARMLKYASANPNELTGGLMRLVAKINSLDVPYFLVDELMGKLMRLRRKVKWRDQAIAHLPGRVTLGELWSRFRREAVSFLDNTDTTKSDAVSRAAVLIGFFGEDCEVSQLTERDQAAFVSQRLAGGVQRQDGGVTEAVRPRSVEADLVLLHNMLSWATTVRVDGGQRWLKENPLAGVRRIREQNPKRPIATWERFERTREAMRRLRLSSTVAGDQARWVKMELALVLAEATGRRLGSIRQLRWEDIDLVRGTIRWRAESDKKRRESVVPIPTNLVHVLQQFRQLLGAVGGFVFEAPLKPGQPLDRHWFEKWLVVAEEEAKLPKLEGGLWHPYRRKWATERKYLPLKDVAAAGGWRDTETLLKSYQQPDDDTLLAVMNEERKVREHVQGA